MRGTWGRLHRIIARDKATLKGNGVPQSWKYVEKNIQHIKWFFCRSPLRVLRDLSWWVRHRTTNRHHVLNLGLKPGWWDTDTKLLHASFTLLEDYVELEKPFKTIEWNDDDSSREYANEIHSLYLWWKHHKAMSTDSVSWELENANYEEETANLIRLIKIRGTLWT
jgi:hypothetical protein